MNKHQNSFKAASGRHILFAMLLIMLLALSSTYSQAASYTAAPADQADSADSISRAVTPSAPTAIAPQSSNQNVSQATPMAEQIFDHPSVDNLQPARKTAVDGQIFDSPKSGRWPGKPGGSKVTGEKPGSSIVKTNSQPSATPRNKPAPTPDMAPATPLPAPLQVPEPSVLQTQPGNDKQPDSKPIPLRVVIPPAPPSVAQPGVLPSASPDMQPEGAMAKPAETLPPMNTETSRPQEAVPGNPVEVSAQPGQQRPAQASDFVPPSIREAAQNEAMQSGVATDVTPPHAFATPDFTPLLKQSAAQSRPERSNGDPADFPASGLADVPTDGPAGGGTGYLTDAPVSGQAGQASSAPPAPPIGRISPVFATSPPELAGVGEEDPAEAASREATFNLRKEIGVEIDQGAQERFAGAIPGFDLEEADISPSQGPEAFTVNRGPAGQMGD
ncbi:MAG: hypothetical protein LBV80_02250 [Deltaproteobacteria bacterium]|jgi:hypothetical protein|nr:hypothetical protein [Deltaproteobacteria bacterium]